MAPVGDGLPANHLKAAHQQVFQNGFASNFLKREDYIFLRKQACTYKKLGA
ncbi:hypothetical protein PTUN_a1831 [Pseudoalteromonas tunicata]|jgi:hypothetical protein|uniref:Uncharacterized protein n=1 Tax=Pseudoalteromonas tunicata D2 TaxID=87626 RepID=A4CBX0_9GAMM|nr:hypothetical protein PTUN_a1831 [Pseudoalteromonas tunicata]EAR27857.1 hypothetical protein PTD2_18585 [Pseudoalteromonas tunicata D2]